MVARCARTEEGSGGRAPGQPGLEWPDPPGGRSAATGRVAGGEAGPNVD